MRQTHPSTRHRQTQRHARKSDTGEHHEEGANGDANWNSQLEELEEEERRLLESS